MGSDPPPSNKADLMLHPLRLRILTELSGKQLTTLQLASALPDIPQASLYRHVGTLLEAGALEIVSEQRVNGAIERTYRIAQGQDRIGLEELRRFSPDDHLRYFNLFTASLLERFAAFVQGSPPAQIPTSGMAYNRTVLYLSDEERAALQAQFVALIAQVMSNTPSPQRKRYTMASVVIPDERKTT